MLYFIFTFPWFYPFTFASWIFKSLGFLISFQSYDYIVILLKCCQAHPIQLRPTEIFCLNLGIIFISRCHFFFFLCIWFWPFIFKPVCTFFKGSCFKLDLIVLLHCNTFEIWSCSSYPTTVHQSSFGWS